MMQSRLTIPLSWVVVSLFVFSGSAIAQGKSDGAKYRNYGIGQPKNVDDLPYGKFRNQLKALPPKSQGKALGWLRDFSFPAEDVHSLKVNRHGDISYADSFLPTDQVEPQEDQLIESSFALDLESAFQLHSKPGSSKVLYLDFDGEDLTGRAWGDGNLVALPFDPSGNDNPETVANFTESELARIHEIWHRISEDFAAFDIDVTTEEPAVFTTTTGHVLITHDVDANGINMPALNAGGVAWVNMFGKSNYFEYSPALVYYTNLASGYAPYVAEAGSHEFGHNLGLSHDGADGTTYYRGHGNGMVDWSPIMGNSYQRNVTQWSKGEYSTANNTQDDIAIIAADLGFTVDDHGDSAGTSTELVVESNGDILVSSPEIDPHNALDQNKGIINDRADVDWFFVDVSESSQLTVSGTPAWHSFTRNDYRGSNMDIELVLMDSDLSIIAADESDQITNAEVSVAVSPGRYYVQIDGIGNDTQSNYTDYASTGMFFLEGTIQTSGSDGDKTAPSPATMSWATSPKATGTSSMNMVAVIATDESGPVEYYFTCVAGGVSCPHSGWQSSNTYAPEGLESDTYYAFEVKARDALGNENNDSPIMGDTTEVEVDEPPPVSNEAPVAVASYLPKPAVITKGNSVTVTLDGSESYDPDGHIRSWTWRDGSGNEITSQTMQARLRTGEHVFSLTVTDDAGASATVDISVSVSKGGADDGDEKPPKKTPPGKK